MERFSETSLIDEAILEEIDDIDASNHFEAGYTDEDFIDDRIRELRLDQLPRQFKKPILDFFDRRFIISLIISLLIHIGFFYLAPYFILDESDTNMIQRMHQRFVTTLLQDNERFGSSGQAISGNVFGTVNEKAQRDLSRMIEEIILGIVQSGEDIPDFSPVTDKILTPEMIEDMKKNFIPSAESKKDAHKKALERLAQTKSEIAEKVNNIGLLGIVTNGSGYNDYEYIADILDNANRRAENLDKVLQEINALQVPRFERHTAWMDPNDVSVGLKTGRTKRPNQNQFYETVEPLAKVEQIPISRNVDVDLLGSPLAGLNRKKAANGKYRSYSHISKVVASHKKAIQDCYKQVLKNQPNLKGRMVVRFSIDPGGKVVSAEIISATINHPKIERCILNRIRRWNDFGPCDPKMGTMTFQIPYNFGTE